MTIGVVIVTYNSATVIRDCLHSLHQSQGVRLKVIVIDNASTDHTRDVIRDWAEARLRFAELPSIADRSAAPEFADLMLASSAINAGFAAGVNVGLKVLLPLPDIQLFWILNPDARVRPDTAAHYARRAAEVGRFGLMGGRTLYMSPADIIQSDGGTVNAWTGMCANCNLGRRASATPYPAEARFDYIPGANVVASREFLETVGLMEEGYFLYYEEVDWALRRGALKLAFAPGAVVEHHGGSAIGSPVLGRTQGSPFSNYFNYRNRMRFMRRFFPRRLPVAYLYSALKIARLAAQGFHDEARAAFCGLHDLSPPKSVRRRLSDEAARVAFGE